MNALRAFWRDDAGSVQAETAILIAFIALAGIGLWRHFGETATAPPDQTTDFFSEEPAAPVRPLVRPTVQDFAQPR